MNAKLLNEDRLFPSDEVTRQTARLLYSLVKNAPIISPHGHTDAAWFSGNEPFQDAVSLLLWPDHYLLRMLYSQGISLESLGLKSKNSATEADKRKIWKLFAKNFYLFRGTPSSLWLNYVFYEIFKFEKEFNESTSDFYFDRIGNLLKTENFLPRALFEKFKIEVLATTDAATDSLEDHLKIHSEWGKRVLPTYRPDAAIDPEHEDFYHNISKLSELTKEDASTWIGYLRAHRVRRDFFKKAGATATDHGPASARTVNLSEVEAENLFSRVMKKNISTDEAELFRAHMLWQMAAMSADDGLVMQLHAGSYRNHNPWLFENFGRDKGADIPMQMEYTRNLKPLLDSFGNNRNLKLILFTLDETTYSRELAPLAGHYPSLRLGPAWWFHDSPEGMIRHRKQTLETAGFYNVTGFIDDTRAFFSIPARHDVARRIDARVLAELVVEHRMTEEEARDTIVAITTSHAKECFRL